jgi:PilZ domain
MVGIVTNLSLGGCYVETSCILLPGSRVKLSFSFEHTAATLECEVVRMDMGIGAAIKFTEMNHESRSLVQHILEKMATSEARVDHQRGKNAAAGLKL